MHINCKFSELLLFNPVLRLDQVIDAREISIDNWNKKRAKMKRS